MKEIHRPYHNAYSNLAAAIIESGRKHNDTRFLESDWCGILKEICALDDEMYGRRGDTIKLPYRRGVYNERLD